MVDYRPPPTNRETVKKRHILHIIFLGPEGRTQPIWRRWAGANNTDQLVLELLAYMKERDTPSQGGGGSASCSGRGQDLHVWYTQRWGTQRGTRGALRRGEGLPVYGTSNATVSIEGADKG